MKHYLMALCALALSGIVIFAPSSAHDDENHDDALTVSDVWARKTRRTMSAAVYMTLHNGTSEPDMLVAVDTPHAEMATLHQSSEQNGIMRMEQQDDVLLNPGETVTFEPGGHHVMLMQLSGPLEEGDVFPLILTFERAGDVTVYVTVTGIEGWN